MRYPPPAAYAPVHAARGHGAKPVGPLAIVTAVVVMVWAVLALVVGIVALVYLGLGVVMTYELSGVFGDGSGMNVNRALLFGSLISPVIGFVVAACVLAMGVTAMVKQRPNSAVVMVLGIISLGLFCAASAVQYPLLDIVPDVLRL
ncbi:hypothetical protein [Brevibacterium samyangense]